MKTTNWIALGVAVGLLAGPVPAILVAEQVGSDSPHAPQNVIHQPGEPAMTAITHQEGNIVLTGSRIPQVIRRVGRITNGSSPVTVFDHAQIERSGASTVIGVLRMDPAIRFRSGP